LDALSLNLIFFIIIKYNYNTSKTKYSILYLFYTPNLNSPLNPIIYTPIANLSRIYKLSILHISIRVKEPPKIVAKDWGDVGAEDGGDLWVLC